MQPGPLPVTLPQALSFRLRRQHLASPAVDALTAAISLIGAQAQVHSAAILQLRARAQTGADAAGMAAALYGRRDLVKLWAHRSTLHLMPATDLSMLLAVRRLRIGAYQQWYANEGLEPAQVEILVAAIAETLADGPHSRMDLSRRLVPRLGDWAKPWLEHSWGGVIKLACALGHVCHGPALGTALDGEAEEVAAREARFVRLEDWLPGGAPAPMEGRAAAAALLRRYLGVFGPAGPADFRKFTGLPAGPVHQAFADLATDLVPVSLAGKPAFLLADDQEAVALSEPMPGHIAVLPLFDPWLLAHNDTAQYVDDRHRPAIYRTAGWISPVVLRQGRVIAHWSHRRVGGARTRGEWRVRLSPLEKIYRKELPAIRAGLRRLSGGLPVVLEEM